MEQEKKIRREIANSNERRRMQSINSGFANLRTLLPQHEGEKLSKASILQQTADYIYSLEQEKTRLLSQNCQLKRLLGQTQHLVDTDETDSAPAPKRRLIEAGQKLFLEDEEDLTEIQNKLDKERRTRMALEERVRGLENQLISSNRKEIIQRYSTEEAEETVLEYPGTMTLSGQTVLTPAAKKQGVETVLPSIIHCVKGDGGRVEVEPIPRITEVAAPDQQPQTLEIANVQDPETGVTRQYIVTTQMNDTTSKQNLETIVEAIRHLEGDHLFSDQAGPHEVVKEEIVESCINIEDNGNVVEMSLPGSVFTTSAIINSLPQVPVPLTSSAPGPGSANYQLTVSLPTVPVASMQNQTQQIQVRHSQSMSGGSYHGVCSQVPVTVSNLVSSLQQPLPQAQVSFLPQVPVSIPHASLPPVSSLTGPGPAPLDLGHSVPPQTSPVNLELAGSGESGSVTPTGEMTGSPPQSSPVNLAQPSQNQEC